MFWQVIFTVLGLGAFFGAGYAISSRRAARRHTEENRLSVRTMQDLTAQLERTTAERQDFARRAEENRLAIERALKERDQAWHLYDEQSVAHGNAQAMMLDAIGHQQQKLCAAGVTVPLPSIIQETHELFVAQHVGPALQRSGATVVHRGVSAEITVPTEKG